MRRKKKNQSEEVDNFFVSWGDLVSLLLVFFVYLFSISEIDPIKFYAAKESLSKEISAEVPISRIEKLKIEQEKLQEIQENIKDFIEAEELQDVLDVKYLEDRLELNFGNALLFATGASDLKTKAIDVIQTVSNMVKATESKIIVEGHTDNIPIKSKKFPSNWELSAARAGAVARTMIKTGVEARRFMVIGRNKYAPLAKNDSPKNRAKNRRVKITIKPDTEALLSSGMKGTK